VVRVIVAAISLCVISGCTKKTPSQVIYRFDDNRYLELIGYDCEGYVVYHDTKRNITKSIYGNPIYRVFTGVYIHPSEQYILVPEWEPGAYKISKDYGQTWQVATYMAPFPALERNSDGVMRDYPEGKEIKRVVVVNNQAFITTSQHHLYMSSYPFDDPRLKPGGPGIDYKYFDDTDYLSIYTDGKQKSKGKYFYGHIKPESPGRVWGMVIFMKKGLDNLVESEKSNYQNLPDKEPEVVGYKGWTRMYCNMNAGK
jgi:hypothetical protein